MINNTDYLLNFNTHRVKITVSQLHIHCFKYNGHLCSWEQFDLEQQEAAAEWSITPPNNIVYRVDFPGETAE